MSTKQDVRQQIKETIERLAQEQGYYSIVLQSYEEDNWEGFNTVCDHIEFKDVIDFINWLEV